MSGRSPNHKMNAIWLYWMRKHAYLIARSHKRVTVENLRRHSERLANRGITVDPGMWSHIFRDKRFVRIDSYRETDCEGGRLVSVYALIDDVPPPPTWAGIAPFNSACNTAGRYRA